MEQQPSLHRGLKGVYFERSIVYDTRKLLSDVRETVRAARAEKGLPPPPMPLFLEDNADHDFPKPGKR